MGEIGDQILVLKNGHAFPAVITKRLPWGKVEARDEFGVFYEAEATRVYQAVKQRNAAL